MIEIGIPPNLLLLGGEFVLSWHGFFAAVSILIAVFLVGRWAPLFGLESDDVYTVASFAIIGGIIGARLVHVLDNVGYYSENPAAILAIWKGGIGLWGGLIGVLLEVQHTPSGLNCLLENLLIWLPQPFCIL